MNYDIPPNTDNENLDDNKGNLENENKQVYETPSPEQAERLEQWKVEHPGESIPFELRRESFEKELAQVNQLIEEFEKRHDLNRLFEIKELPLKLLGLFKIDRNMSAVEVGFYIGTCLKDGTMGPQDVENYYARTEAKKDLIPITDVFLVMQSETQISFDQLNEYKLPYRELSKAVGMITANSNVIDHTR